MQPVQIKRLCILSIRVYLKMRWKMRLKQLIKALKNELEEVEVYQVIWDEYGDANGDLGRMADFFGVPLEKQILMIANNHCKKILVNCCKPYEYKEDMALQAAIKIEKNLLSSMREFHQ